MKKIRLKQGTLAWETARETRIGSSEVFDIIRYYATNDELQNCGLNAEVVKEEKPFTTVWALYHKILGDGIYKKLILAPELAEYGHAVEPYGAAILAQGRNLKLKRGEVYTSDRLIASLDVSGISEEIDNRKFDYGDGDVPIGQKFVCEQKSIMPNVLKNGLPIKYIIQAQYQITMSRAAFFILQIMTLENDTVYERGKIVQLSCQSLKKLQQFLNDKMQVRHIYFANNERLGALIKVCLKRFFDDVDKRNEPLTFLPNDCQKNIIESLRINSFYDKNKELLCTHLKDYIHAKQRVEDLENDRLAILQKIIDEAKLNNISKFISSDGYRACFDARGAFLVKEPKEVL